MSVQNCVCEAQESISENLAKRLNEAYSHKEILAFGKIAYIDSYGYESDGIYEHFLYKNALDFVDLYSDFEKLELGKYCAMVLGMSIDEVELWRHREKLYEFLDNGGVVISFCHNYTGILPNNAGYIKSEVEIRDREVRLVGHALTDGVREYDINFRRGVKGFFNRGYFEIPKNLLESTHPLSPLSAKEGESICRPEPLGEVSKESTFSCHTSAFEKSRSMTNLQDRDISLALNMTNDDRDILVSSKPQYDNVDTSLAKPPKKDSMDCHALDSATTQNLIARNDKNANSFNDIENSFNNKNNGLPRAISCARNDGEPLSLAEGDKGGGDKPFEVFLRDSEGKCVGYIDRISTNGVILATAGADLLTFGVFENNSARRLGLNLLSWLGRELKVRESNLQNRDISLPLNMTNTNASQSGRFHFDADIIKAQNPKNPLRKNPTLKNAIITGGASYERNFFYNKDAKYAHFFDKRIYHKDAQNIDFSEFDYIVIASRANPRFLLPCKEKFLEFLKNGGSIVSFGEVTQGYLPNIAWKEYGVNFWWWLSQGADMSFEVGEYGKGLFSKMELFDAKWHYHGAFYPPKDSQMILANELNEAIIYKDTSFKGGLYVTSLDPDFHLGQGFMPKTEGFFDTFMGWVEEDILKTRI